jgi:glycosyltransferase involved in cell wall biosynthesis
MKAKAPVIIIITPGFPANEEDSTCLPAQQNFIKAVNTNFSEVEVLILSFQYPFTKVVYQWYGNTVIAFGGKNKGNLSRFIIWKRVWQQLKNIHKEKNVMGLLSFWCGECAFVAQRFAKKFDLQHYCWLLGQDARKENHYVKRVDVKGTGFIALSDFIQHEFFNNYGIRPANIIPLGIDIHEYQDKITDREIDVLAAGSLIPLKQYDVFIEVIAVLKKEYPQIKAMLCGDGPEMQKLQTIIHHLSLQNNIILSGEKSHSEVLATMQKAKIFLHTSSYEGFGMVCTEALYAGAQVISFCKPMNAAIKNWHIVQDKEAMIEKAISLLNHLPPVENVLPYSIDDTAKAVFKLFAYQAD